LVRKLTLLIVMLVVASILAACGGGAEKASDNGSKQPAQQKDQSSNTQQAEQSSGNEPITLRFAWWGNDPRHQATLEALDKYMELNPHVTVEAEYMGYDGYLKKLATQFAGNLAPDLFQYNNAFTDQIGDFIYDLLQAGDLIDTSTFPEATIRDAGMHQGKLIQIPAGIIAAGTIQNTTFFEKHGIPSETEWTWDNLLEIGKKVHETDSNDYLLTADIDVIDKLILVPYITQKSGKLWVNDDYTMNVTEEELTEAYSYLKSLYDNGVLEPFGDSTAFVAKMEQNPKWVNGQIGMLLDYVSAYDKYVQAVSGGTISVGPFPSTKDAVQSANPLVAGVGYAINKDSAHREEAAKLLNWLVNDPAAAVILTTQRGIPGSSTALAAITEAGLLNAEIKKGIDMAARHESLPLTPLSDSANLRLVHVDSVQRVIYNVQTPNAAAREALINMKDKLTEMKEAVQ
jgi:oligogalacturonide transport system substrate-binding protein